MLSIFDSLQKMCEQNEPAALGIIIDIKGSSPQKKGAKALFYSDGRIEGTLGGGCLEAEIQDRARQALITQIPATFELVLDHDFGWDDGLICGGKVCGVILPHAIKAVHIWKKLAQRNATMTWGVKRDFAIAWAEDTGSDRLYQETVYPPCALWIAGAGHIAQAVAPLSLQLDFTTTVFDDRPTLANHRHFPSGTHLRTGSWDNIFKEPFPPVPTFGLVVTRGHRHDALVLQRWIEHPFAFLGMIGSRRKARMILEHFLEEKIAGEEAIKRVVCPVGLDIGAVSVHEIAVSIMAQCIQKRTEVNHEKIHTASSCTEFADSMLIAS